ncbi:MAG: phosphodiesterase, partial [Candidatus Brocadiales bacterium]|nr:phosphodiesterase [Candidatus Brocadiales bacterium]
ENDTGPDDANHSQQGIFIMKNGMTKNNIRKKGATIYDIAPTILKYMDVRAPQSMEGKAIL